MSKYAYKTEITKFGELKVHFPTLNFTNFTKFDAAKQSARDIAKTTLLSWLQTCIDQRKEIPTVDDYPFVAERIELDWQTKIRVQLSNWFIKNSRLNGFDEIDKRYRYLVDREISDGILSKADIFGFFNLKTDLDLVGLVSLAYDFKINMTFKEVKLEFKDND